MSSLELDFLTVDVFTDTRFTGNPLAITFLPSGSSLPQQTKQLLAREFNLSETLFLYLPSGCNSPTPHTTLPDSVMALRADIFTVEEELPFAGHPTIGAAWLIRKYLGWKNVQKLVIKAGEIPIQEVEGGFIRAGIPHAYHIHNHTLGSLLTQKQNRSGNGGPTVQEIESVLSHDQETREAELQAPAVSVVRGLTFLLVRLPSLEHLARVAEEGGNRITFGEGSLLDEGEWGTGFVARYYYVLLDELTCQRNKKVYKVRSRMVELGFEDPATGSAACTLAGYLGLSEVKEGEFRLEVVQGVEMGRRSEVVVDVDVQAGEVKEVWLGGKAEVVMSGRVIL